MAWKCPHCSEILDHLGYNVEVTDVERGTASLNDENTPGGPEITEHSYDENSGSEWSGNPSYECPECWQGVLLSSLTWDEEDEEEETPAPATTETPLRETHFRIITPKTPLIRSLNANMDISRAIIFCPDCERGFTYSNTDTFGEEGETIMNCPRCSRACSKNETREMISSEGFFSKNKTHDKPKTAV